MDSDSLVASNILLAFVFVSGTGRGAECQRKADVVEESTESRWSRVMTWKVCVCACSFCGVEIKDILAGEGMQRGKICMQIGHG